MYYNYYSLIKIIKRVLFNAQWQHVTTWRGAMRKRMFLWQPGLAAPRNLMWVSSQNYVARSSQVQVSPNHMLNGNDDAVYDNDHDDDYNYLDDVCKVLRMRHSPSYNGVNSSWLHHLLLVRAWIPLTWGWEEEFLTGIDENNMFLGIQLKAQQLMYMSLVGDCSLQFVWKLSIVFKISCQIVLQLIMIWKLQ